MWNLVAKLGRDKFLPLNRSGCFYLWVFTSLVEFWINGSLSWLEPKSAWRGVVLRAGGLDLSMESHGDESLWFFAPRCSFAKAAFLHWTGQEVSLLRRCVPRALCPHPASKVSQEREALQVWPVWLCVQAGKLCCWHPSGASTCKTWGRSLCCEVGLAVKIIES